MIDVVITCAGEGIRLSPITDTTPKCLVKINKKPIMFYTIDNLIELGIKKIIYIIGYLGDVVREEITRSYPDIENIFILQEKLNGTANAIKLAKGHVNDNFIVLAGDTIFHKKDLDILINVKNSVLGTVIDYDILKKKIREYGTLKVTNDYYIKFIAEKTSPISNIINCNGYNLPITTFDYMDKTPSHRKTKEVIITETINGMIRDKLEFKCILCKSLDEISRVEDIENLERKLTFNEKMIDDYLEEISKLNVLVIGETMIDRYYFGNQMIPFRTEYLIEFFIDDMEEYLGGAGLVSNNVAEFVNSVDLFTLTNKNYKYITDRLKERVRLIPIPVDDYPMPVKIRYVDNSTKKQYLKATIMNDNPISESIENTIISKLDMDKYDIVIVIDKGHGLMTDRIIDFIRVSNKYISINCQANSENRGFNRIDRYKKVNIITLNQMEMRMLLQDKYSDELELIDKFNKIINYDRLVFTMSSLGCIITNGKDIKYAYDDINREVVDSIGAGDAVQVIVTLLSYVETPLDLTATVGNIAGGIVCRTVGTNKGLLKEDLLQELKYESKGLDDRKS